MSLVVDSSVALSWCFDDERTAATLAVLSGIAEAGAVAPSLWPLEICNGLLMAERRKRLTARRRHRLLAFLRELPISLDDDTAVQTWSRTGRLAEEKRLTVYDACYLELAERLRVPLATLDGPLRSAAKALRIDLRGLDGDA